MAIHNQTEPQVGPQRCHAVLSSVMSHCLCEVDWTTSIALVQWVNGLCLLGYTTRFISIKFADNLKKLRTTCFSLWVVRRTTLLSVLISNAVYFCGLTDCFTDFHIIKFFGILIDDDNDVVIAFNSFESVDNDFFIIFQVFNDRSPVIDFL